MKEEDVSSGTPGKLEWMYKGPGNTVDREEYLLGKAVTNSSTLVGVKNEVERDCLPTPLLNNSTLRTPAGPVITDQVDIARKIHEDPLLAIKKKEIEKREQLLKNPVKMKKLQEMLKRQRSKQLESSSSDKKKRKRTKRQKEDSVSDSSDDIDKLLKKKYKKLKGKLDLDDISSLSNNTSSGKSHKAHKSSKEVKSSQMKDKKCNKKYKSNKSDSSNRKRKNNHRKETSSSNSSSSESNSDSDSSSDSESNSDSDSNRKRTKIPHRGSKKSKKSKVKVNEKSNNIRSHKSKHSSSDSDNSHDNSPDLSDDNKKKYGLLLPASKEYLGAKRNNSSDVNFSTPIKKTTKLGNASNNKEKSKFVRPKPVKLSEAEKEERRREMMKNAEWRNDLRDQNMKSYREKDEKEKRKEKDYSDEFYRNQLSYAASQGSVEGRIKSNINRIQRTASAMDKNFARR